MYSFLDFLSELLERYSWAIVPSLISALVIALIWSKVPKPEPRLREAKTQHKARTKIATTKKIPRSIKLSVVIIGICVMIGAAFINRFSGINYLIILGIGAAIYNFGIWVL